MARRALFTHRKTGPAAVALGTDRSSAIPVHIVTFRRASSLLRTPLLIALIVRLLCLCFDLLSSTSYINALQSCYLCDHVLLLAGSTRAVLVAPRLRLTASNSTRIMVYKCRMLAKRQLPLLLLYSRHFRLSTHPASKPSPL
jgi:hypothetical protein